MEELTTQAVSDEQGANGVLARGRLDDWWEPKRPRRGAGERHPGPALGRLDAPEPGRLPSVNATIQAMLNWHATNWSVTQRRNCRDYLLSATGRFQKWCRAEGIERIDDLTLERVAEFLRVLRDGKEGAGLKGSTVNRYRTHLRSLGHFQADVPGHGTGLLRVDVIPRPRMPKETVLRALTREQEQVIRDAAKNNERDLLILETFLALGLRRSELAGLLISNLQLGRRTPVVVVEGTAQDPDCTKGRKPRTIPFRPTYASSARRLGEWVQERRDPKRQYWGQEVFLTRKGKVKGLDVWGIDAVCERISLKAGVHFSPHDLRHTWATRWVDAGVQPVHLMAMGGWESIEMVRRYYTPREEEMLAALAKFRA